MTAEDRRERCCKCAGPVEDEVMCFPAPRLCIACMPTPTPLAGTCAPVAEDRREDREAKLRERASEIDADAHDNYCGTTCPPDDSHDAPLFIKRVLDALRQTAEEEREAAYSDWDLRANAAYAEGERAGREAEREAAALLVEDGHGNIGRMLAAAIRARGSE